MRTYRIVAAFASTLFGAAGYASAQTQVVTYEVTSINSITFSGSPSLTINAANPTTVSDVSATYAIVTNGTGMKIIGSIASAMPAGLTLWVNLTAPSGGSSLGLTELTGGGDQDLVTGITSVDESGIAVTYTLTATAAHAVVSSATKTVTYTIVAGS
jgi:hypothetical protein